MSDIVSYGIPGHFPICNKCIHKLSGGKCEAFPDRIPDEIFSGKNDHFKPLAGQTNDIVFEAKEMKADCSLFPNGVDY